MWWVLEGIYREARRAHVSFAFSKVKCRLRPGTGLLLAVEVGVTSWLQVVIISGLEPLGLTGLFFMLTWPESGR